MRVLFCGGGTAGHVNPAIAVAQTVMRNSNENKVAYVATMNGIENELVDFKKFHIDVIGLKRKFTLKNITFIRKQLKAIEKCKEIIREFHPDIVFGTGGYATYPVVVAAKKLGIKTILHESNVIPGKAIQTLEKKADRILVNFEESKKYFKEQIKIIRTGNPLRNGFECYEKDKAKKSLGIKEKNIILCTSGSLGAERINNASVELIEHFIRHRKDVFFIWSTGKSEYYRVTKILETKGLSKLNNILVGEYFPNIPMYMSAADVVISRAGAMTISELAYLKKATILVPSPNVTNNHQYLNAKALQDSLATVMITEDRLYLLADVLKELLEDGKKRKMLEENIGEYAVKGTNKTIYNIMTSLI